MKSYGLRRLKDEGNVGVVCVNVSIWIIRESERKTELAAYSMNLRRDSVAVGSLSFFTSKIFLGGADHLRDRRSLSRVSVSVSPGLFD